MVGNSTRSRWQRGQSADEDARLFGLFGRGFVTTSSGRVFLPLIGRAKAVPSAEAERLLTGGRRRKWLVAIAAVALCIAIIWTLNAFPLSSIARAVVILSGPLVILGLSFWRDRALTKSWANIEGAGRTDLIIDALNLIPSSRLLTVLCAELIFGDLSSIFGLQNWPFGLRRAIRRTSMSVCGVWAPLSSPSTRIVGI